MALLIKVVCAWIQAKIFIDEVDVCFFGLKNCQIKDNQLLFERDNVTCHFSAFLAAY